MAQTISPSQLKTVLTQTIIPSGISAFITGAPGIGKSDLIRSVANDLDLEVVDVRASLLDPVDLRGLPSIDGGETTWNQPDFLPTEGKGIIFLDEINVAPKLVQGALYQLVLDRKLGDYDVPEGWVVIAAGNRKEDRAIVQDAGTALATRFVHLDLVPDLDDWTDWAVQDDSGIATEVLAFVRFRPELLHKFSADEKTHPTPRTWAFASKVFDTKPDRALRLPLYSGCVGEAAAVEFTGFLDIMERIPSIDEVLMDPDGADVPEAQDVAVLYALTAALAKKATKENVAKVFQYLKRLPEEFGGFCAKAMLGRDKNLGRTKAFTTYAINNQDVLL